VVFLRKQVILCHIDHFGINLILAYQPFFALVALIPFLGAFQVAFPPFLGAFLVAFPPFLSAFLVAFPPFLGAFLEPFFPCLEAFLMASLPYHPNTLIVDYHIVMLHMD